MRQDVSGNIATRAAYRKGRRYRKTRYRKPRFDNRVGSRRRVENWLPPSVQAKVNHNINWIERMRSVVPQATVVIELGKFDSHKLKDPSIEGVVPFMMPMPREEEKNRIESKNAMPKILLL